MRSPRVRGRRKLVSALLHGRSSGLLAGGLALAGLLTSCQEDDLLKPGDTEVNVLSAFYVPNEIFDENTIELDGLALEREWGGPLDRVRTYHQIRMSREEGSGDPGEPKIVSCKAVYTDTDLYVLCQWSDGEPDEMKDATFYYGPDLYPDTLGLYYDRCLDFLPTDQVWSRIPPGGTIPLDEDRLSIAWQMEPTRDELGSFEEQGCQVACHVGRSPAFGTPTEGRLDVWTWLAARTNRLRNLYKTIDSPVFPRWGTPAYLEDYVCEPVGGLIPDPGTPAWRQNWVGDHTYPLRVYRALDDPLNNEQSNCRNDFGEECKINNRIDVWYDFQEDGARFISPFGSCDTINTQVLPQGQALRKWVRGDAIAGYWYTYPSGSRADVRGTAEYVGGADNRWTLEIARPLDTLDPANDVIFTGEAGSEVYFTVALMDNNGAVHWGSGPQRIRFGPKSAGRTSADPVEGGK